MSDRLKRKSLVISGKNFANFRLKSREKMKKTEEKVGKGRKKLRIEPAMKLRDRRTQ